MATVADILKFVESIAPPGLKESWDNVGLLCGRRDREVKKILVALDPFLPVCREAVALGADVLLTHHPLIFSPLKAVSETSEAGECALTLIENGIAAINAHTNLDMAPGGVNDVLAAKVGLGNVEVLPLAGQDHGLIRIGTVEEMPLADFLAQVKAGLGTPVLRYCDGGKPVRQVAVGGGACGGAIDDAAAAGCDTFVTSDIKYNQFRDAQYAGLNLIDAGHFYTENPVCDVLAEQLRKAFPEMEVLVSEIHRDCAAFF